MKNNQPIGVFDSGLGGLTVVKELTRILPNEDIVYFGDTARVPYGPRSPQTIKKFSEENTEFLLSKKVKCIVIACNTSSAVAGEYLKKKFNKIPVFEVINPAAGMAAKTGKKIGVIGTRATIKSGVYEKDIKKYSKEAKVFSIACPLFVPFIEEGEIKGPALALIAKEYLEELRKQKIDTLVMGCTHYPIIKKIIEKAVDNHVRIIDPGLSVAEEVAEYLKKSKLLNPKNVKGKKSFFVSDLTDRFTSVASMFLGEKINGSTKEVRLKQ